MPEAQLRCTVNAGTDFGTPASSAATRARFAASAGVPQLPSTTSSMRAGSNSVRASSSLTATRPSSWAGTSLSALPDLANGVRTPSTRTTVRPRVAFTPIATSVGLPQENLGLAAVLVVEGACRRALDRALQLFAGLVLEA